MQIVGNSEVYDSRCLACRLTEQRIQVGIADIKTKKLMRYHGVRVSKITESGKLYLLVNNKWKRGYK